MDLVVQELNEIGENMSSITGFNIDKILNKIQKDIKDTKPKAGNGKIIHTCPECGH
jgi:hypothetical protein